jgi:predicted RNA binding protein YcfA (HicA-like mRNA interferase family)
MGGMKTIRQVVIGSLNIQKKTGTVTIAGKPSKDVPKGTLNNILKQAKLKK